MPYWWVDAGMASEHLLLGAVDAGLGACFFGPFGHEDDILAGLGVPDGWRAVGTVALGHPAPDPPGLSASPASAAAPSTRSSTAAAGERRRSSLPSGRG